MKEERTIELRREEVAEILAKHFGMAYGHPHYYALDGKAGLNAKIHWKGSEEKLESKEEGKQEMKSGQEILDEYDKMAEGSLLPKPNEYEERTLLVVLLQIREDIHSIAKKLKREEK